MLLVAREEVVNCLGVCRKFNEFHAHNYVNDGILSKTERAIVG